LLGGDHQAVDYPEATFALPTDDLALPTAEEAIEKFLQ